MNIKIDEKIKETAQKKAAELGLSLSSVVNATLSQFARTGELSVRTTSPKLNMMVADARKELKEGKTEGPFSTADDMIDSLDA
ncbi:type II toxin-antitoxin system RelB/DinJ family antitoxin [Candidatus Kaiserbacteria bacterium]|nr:type II toxin-antitoxin system RelB/DinJ family antitoxin [Candidatus Kaiserbacteria bacterium]